MASPFKGLHAFQEIDAADFFGRDRLVADVVSRLRGGIRLVALVGPSGSGKSSVVRAGVVPALRKGSLPGSNEWLIASMIPGAHPMMELEAALLRSTLDAPDTLDAQLADPELGLLRAALRLLPQDRSRLVLVIDQFEELFTLVADEDERRRFLENLVAAIDDPYGRVLIVLTLRADSYYRPLSYGKFAERLGAGVVNVVPLTTDELWAAAAEPASRQRGHFEPALLAELLKDVVGQPGALPLFQYTLTELFDVRVGDRLTVASYGAIGGPRGGQPAGRRPVPLDVPGGQDRDPTAVPPARRARGAGHLGSTAGRCLRGPRDRRRRRDDGVGDRPTGPAPLPRVRPRPHNRRADCRGGARGAPH